MSCVKTKRNQPAVPKDLYTSPYFRKMREYAEREHDEWWIISAKHGLLDPDGEPIEPYDETLSGARVARRREWAGQVSEELDERGLLDESTQLVIHAGKSYYEELIPVLEESEVGGLNIPTDGLAFGETLAWYNERL